MKFISLFSGAMGLDLGLERAGFECVACVENDKPSVLTIKANRPNLAVFDISVENVSGQELIAAGGFGTEVVPLVVGGPPCQAFSVFGNRLGIEDARGQLLFEFVRLIDEIRPSTFVMENVRGLLSMSLVPPAHRELKEGKVPPQYFEKGSLLKHIFEEFNSLGYQVDCFVVNSVNYGAPQIRERVLLVGNKHQHKAIFPQPMYSNRPEDNLPVFKTLGDAIGPSSEFVEAHPDVMNFSPRKLKYLSMIPAGGNWRSLPVDIQKESMGKSWFLKGGRSAYWRKLSFAFPSPTVVTMPNHAGTSMCHPTELRAISVGEAAAIQEFPQSWVFQGSTTQKFKQIGNAVPVRLGEIVGKVVMELLEKISSGVRLVASEPNYQITHLRPHVRTRTYWKNGSSFAGETSYYAEEAKLEQPTLF